MWYVCFAKGIELLSGNDVSTVEFSSSSAYKIPCHTPTILVTQNTLPYPKATHKTCIAILKQK